MAGPEHAYNSSPKRSLCTRMSIHSLQQSVKFPQIMQKLRTSPITAECQASTDLAEAAYLTWCKARETSDSTWLEEGTLAWLQPSR